MVQIPGYNNIVNISAIDKGWSNDKKYCIETNDGTKLLLRLSDISELEKKKAEFQAVCRISKLDIKMMMPVKMGVLPDDKQLYTLYSWIDGEEAEIVLLRLPELVQYDFGVKSGYELKKIHSIPAPQDQSDWGKRFDSKIDRNISRYRNCGIKVPKEGNIIGFINENRNLLNGRRQSIQHGDYHVGNLLIDENGNLGIIDFDRWDYGDPWEEFNRIVWSIHTSETFAFGQLHGYFNGEPPAEFFKLMALYIASNALASVPWAIPFGEKEVSVMLRNIDEMLVHYENFNQYVPNWYQKMK